MNKNEDEKSFFRLSELVKIQVDKYTIEHNLNRWKMEICEAKIKSDQIQLHINVPYGEMNLSVEEKKNDPEFFDKNVAKINLSNVSHKNDTLISYFSTKTIVVNISIHTQYLIFSTPYFYPHNWYMIYNKDYLYNKIVYSINYIHSFIEAYKNIFQNVVPFFYIKSATETRDHYQLDVILKEYLTISYVKTDMSTSTLFFHLLFENKRKLSNATSSSKYHEITILIPRIIRSGIVDYKFTCNKI